MSNFPDLRTQHSHGNEDFWPSFTDIMMVVVMIFILATAVSFSRNFQLMRDLNAHDAAEQAAREVAQLTASANASLERQLADTSTELKQALKAQAELVLSNGKQARKISQLEAQIHALNEQLSQASSTAEHLADAQTRQDAQQQTIENLRAELAAHTAQNSQLSQQLADTNTENERLQALITQQQNQLSEQVEQITSLAELKEETTENAAELTEARAELAQTIAALNATKASLSQSQASLSEYAQTIDNLTTARADDSQRNEALAQNVDEAQEKLAQLRAEYDSLKTDYDKLVRPARSDKGRSVVTVRIFKSAGAVNFEIKGPGDSSYQRVQRRDMETRLAAFKEEYGLKLYVRIVFPANARIDQNEAWTLTQELLTRFDYYYQPGGPESSLN